MTDAQIEQIYAFGRDAFRGGQREFQIEAFPFRMTAANMARYRKDPNYEFWIMLKEGYDHFEITKVPPKVDVCAKRYVFNQTAEVGATFNPTGACPLTTQPNSLKIAYESYQKTYEAAFDRRRVEHASAEGDDRRSQGSGTGLGLDRGRARGQRVPTEPPAMADDGQYGPGDIGKGTLRA